MKSTNTNVPYIDTPRHQVCTIQGLSTSEARLRNKAHISKTVAVLQTPGISTLPKTSKWYKSEYKIIKNLLQRLKKTGEKQCQQKVNHVLQLGASEPVSPSQGAPRAALSQRTHT